MAAYIQLTEVIDHLDSGMPFSMTYVKADRKTGIGGEIRRVQNWVKCELDSVPETILRRNKLVQFAAEKNPHHSEHKTRNIMDPATRTIKKIHLRLITEFQGKRVI